MYVGIVPLSLFQVEEDLFFHLPCSTKFMVIFQLVRTIALDALRSLNSARKHCMIPFPAVFTLRYTQIHISTLNSYNILANIEASVNESFSFATTLNIPNIYSDNGHVQFRRDLDNSWFGY